MGTKVEVIVSWMTDFVVNNSSCINKKFSKVMSNAVIDLCCTKLWKGSPGGTLSGDPDWKNFVWWFFCATITANFGDHFSSRNLHAWKCQSVKLIKNQQELQPVKHVFRKHRLETSIIWFSSTFKTWLNCDSLTPSLKYDITHKHKRKICKHT